MLIVTARHHPTAPGRIRRGAAGSRPPRPQHDPRGGCSCTLTTSAVDRGEPDVVDRSSPSSMSKALGSVSGLPSRLARLGRAGQLWHHVSPLPPGGWLRGGPADAFVARGFF